LFILVLRQQAIDGEGGSLAVAGQFAHLLHRIGNKQIISSRVNTLRPQAWFQLFRAAVLWPKRKGPQLALEPLNGRGIAGYVPKP